MKIIFTAFIFCCNSFRRESFEWKLSPFRRDNSSCPLPVPVEKWTIGNPLLTFDLELCWTADLCSVADEYKC